MAPDSANRRVAARFDLVAGKAQLQISAPGGRLSETVLPAAAAASGISAATPLVRGLVTLPDFPGEYLEILGIDVFTNEPFRTFDLANFEASGWDLERWLGRAGSLAVSQDFLNRHTFKRADTIRAR